MLSFKKTYSKKEVVSLFFQDSAHEWIHSDRFIKSYFEELFDYMSLSDLTKLIVQTNTKFYLASARHSCFVGAKTSCILVFPELKQLLRSSVKSYALAILAHEIGHVLCDHSTKKIDILKAQVEADAYVCALGLFDQLEQFLLELPESSEQKVRLTYVTSRYFAEH